MLKKVILHIGTPKTGTSIIQSHLAQNRTILRDKGFLYPITISSNKRLYRTFESHHLLTYSWADWEPFKLYSPDWFFKIANSTAEHHNLETLLLSAENVYWLPYQLSGAPKLSEHDYWDRKRRYLETIHDHLSRYATKVVVYLRRQDRWIESWYNQQVKNGFNFDRDMDRFIDHFSYLIDYEKQLELLSEVFGKDNLSVHVYEKEQLPNGLFAHFCEVTGIGASEDFPLDQPARYNAQLTHDALEFMEVCNKLTLEQDQKYRLRLLIRRATNQFESQIVFQAQSLLSPGQRDGLLERYSAMNERIAKSYLGRRDGRLFIEQESQKGDKRPIYTGLSTSALTQLIMQILMEATGEDYRLQNRKLRFKNHADQIKQFLENRLQPLATMYRRRADSKYWNKHIWDYEKS